MFIISQKLLSDLFPGLPYVFAAAALWATLEFTLEPEKRKTKVLVDSEHAWILIPGNMANALVAFLFKILKNYFNNQRPLKPIAVIL